MDKKTALLYAKMPEYKYLVNKTSGFIKWALKQVKNPYVACSFGKDSAVMLHLILQHKPDICVKCYTFDYTELLNNYNEVINSWNLQNYQELKVGLGLGSYREVKEMQKGHDSAFVGIRQQESVGRRIALKKYGMFHKKKDGITRIAPLSEWKTNHIEAYIYSNNVPTLMTYEKVGFESRSTTGLGHDYELEQLEILKQTDISRYNQLMEQIETINNYILCLNN